MTLLDLERQEATKRARRAVRGLLLAGTLVMAQGLLMLVRFVPMSGPIGGHGVFHVVGSLSVMAGGVVINVIALRARRRIR